MDTFLVAVWIVAGAALLRQALGLVVLARFLARARVASIPKGPTPPISLVKPLAGATPELVADLEATLRQNYPAFEVVFLHDPGDVAAAEAADAAAARVPDVPVRRGGAGALHEVIAVAEAAVQPDPLYLRDVANALAEADAVSFAPIVFGMRTFWGRAAGLLLDTETLLSQLLRGARAVTGATIGVRRDVLASDPDALPAAGLLRRARCRLALARRAARVRAPAGTFGASFATAVRGAHEVHAGAPVLLVLDLLLSAAPLLLLAAAVAGAPGWALLLLALHTAMRAVVAVLVDFRFCWDRSLVRALPLLPLLWLVEPAVLVAAAGYRRDSARATLVRSTDGGRAG